MPDKKIEEFFRDLFLDHYNTLTGKHYEFVRRPEEDRPVVEHYDFLYKERHSENDYLAVEEKTLRKSKKNVRDSEVILRLVNGVQQEIKEKGLLSDRDYIFYLDFDSAPKKNELDIYFQKIVDIVEQAIHETRNTDICKQIDFELKGYNCIKRFRLLSNHKSKRGNILFPFHSASNFSRDISGDTLNALSKILVEGDSQLKIPKKEGRKTILLIINCLVLGDEHTIREAMQSIPLELHENVDEIFLVSKKGFDGHYDIRQIK
jgi:hypothetical protein